MKSTERMIEEWTGHKNPTPWGGLAALVITALVVVIIMLLLTSCDPLNRIPLSISYQFENGSSVSIQKPRILPEK